ncbi:putative radical SAM enzyme (TIGR03279 family) [Desulfohalotomaculum tongense]|uniref:DUF512 domain-containing protein n=1 Tax=Desulforadius tongensis TaxID=1216062 RepID=UPI001959C7FF|nr:DUF512 domain-containing protein [Desulforadius tongensis]MBM7854634.1 putative radical SAM enzyme (TIGR03279 family) [Desulforadius tongensis]
MPINGLTVTGIVPGSIGDELGIEPGDKIIEINGQLVRDIIDYRFLTSDEELVVKLINSDGEEWLMEIEKDFDEDLGLDFGTETLGRIKRCQNKCLFCFVDQMAPGMRKSLYVKDDDYRHSFLHGNFVTLTNVREEELQRIINQRLSPLYISVHTTNPQLRRKMMSNPRAANIMYQLETLAEAGIEMHTQVVLCPEINDGEELSRTVHDLVDLYPQVRSLAVVPVGLTKYREGLAGLRRFTPKEAGKIVQQIENWQDNFIARFNYPFVFASDEFYIMSGRPIPPDERYADYPQIENGIGLTRIFLDQWAEAEQKLPQEISPPKKVALVTGSLAYTIIEPVVKRLNKIKGLKVNLYKISNRFFGESVTVAGLITGSDLLQQLPGKDLGDKIIIPAVMLKDQEGDVFLDDITLDELSNKLGVPIQPVNDPLELVETLVKD